MRKRFNSVALAGALLLSPLAAQAQGAADSDWKFSVMPYLWLPTIDGKLDFGPPRTGGISANLTLAPDNYLESLDMALMLSGTARKERWVMGTDLMYLHFSNTKSNVESVDINPGGGPVTISTINAGASADIKGTVWTMVGGYAVVQEPRNNLDVVAGFRYLGLDVKTDWHVTTAIGGIGLSGSPQKKEDIWSGIVGAKGRFNFGESDWFANAYVDVGGGSSVFTWQGAAGIGYAFKWGDVILDYRYLYYSQDNKVIDNLSFGGLALGANFRF
jgi:opacity protein-like surface antigen